MKPLLLFLLSMIITTSARANNALVMPQDTSQPPVQKMVATDQDLEEEHLPIFVQEVMPRFPGCEQLETNQEKKECADQKLLNHIYSNLTYPEEARALGVEGIAVVSFTITEEGKIKDIEVLRNIGAGTAEEAARLIASMQDLDPWIPGQSFNGQPIAVKYNVPIRFKLN